MTPTLVALLPLALAAPVPANDAPTYRVDVLPHPAGATHSSPLAINVHGACVGSFHNSATFFFDGVVWDSDGQPTALSASHGFVEADAIGISDDGTIVGSGSLDGTQVSRGFVLVPGSGPTFLPSLAGDVGVNGAAFDRTSDGFVVGRSALVPTPFWLSVANHAVVWENGVVTSLGSLGGFFSEANHVNEARRIIGRSNTATSDFARGFVWDPGVGMREITPAEPGGLGHAHGLDEQGRIAGMATLGLGVRACVWDDPDLAPTLLAQFPGDTHSVANDLDEAGRLVGSGTTAAGTRARLWVDGGVFALEDLVAEPLPYPLSTALAINENGQILCVSAFTPEHGFVNVLLTPLDPLTAVPAEISLSAGGSQDFALHAGSSEAGHVYWLLGSASGTAPGLPLGALHLPLQFDAYLAFTLANPNTPPLANSLGLLDARGGADAALQLPAGLGAGLVGLELHHAYVTLSLPEVTLSFASNAAPLLLTP